jgi:hypothetical protein
MKPQRQEAKMIMFVIASAMAAAQAGSAPPQTTPTPPTKEKMVCRHIDETGTRMGRHTRCQTAAEWQRDKVEAENAISDVQKQDIIRPDPYALPRSSPQ